MTNVLLVMVVGMVTVLVVFYMWRDTSSAFRALPAGATTKAKTKKGSASSAATKPKKAAGSANSPAAIKRIMKQANNFAERDHVKKMSRDDKTNSVKAFVHFAARNKQAPPSSKKSTGDVLSYASKYLGKKDTTSKQSQKILEYVASMGFDKTTPKSAINASLSGAVSGVKQGTKNKAFIDNTSSTTPSASTTPWIPSKGIPKKGQGYYFGTSEYETTKNLVENGFVGQHSKPVNKDVAAGVANVITGYLSAYGNPDGERGNAASYFAQVGMNTNKAFVVDKPDTQLVERAKAMLVRKYGNEVPNIDDTSVQIASYVQAANVARDKRGQAIAGAATGFGIGSQFQEIAQAPDGMVAVLY